jgi:hypothetical protein
MDDEGGEPIYKQVRDLRVQRLPQKTLLYSFKRVCCLLLIYKGANKRSALHRYFLIRRNNDCALRLLYRFRSIPINQKEYRRRKRGSLLFYCPLYKKIAPVQLTDNVTGLDVRKCITPLSSKLLLSITYFVPVFLYNF